MAEAKHAARSSAAPERASDEADKRQLQMAREEGEAYQQALHYMVHQVADTGGLQAAGDYLVGFAQERAEGMWHLHGERLEWLEPPAGDNCHLEIAVCDGADKRFIPSLDIQATLVAEDGAQRGQQVGPVTIPFVWHPGLYHYGRNLAVPGEGTYTLRVHIAPPTFMRHDHTNGRRYAAPVDVEFRGVHVTPGREQPETGG
ncbi:MAG TPA: iron transporter [Gemmatimonadales bacterium]|nr:iron transporter [Gemmatimonadales bacterium]